MEIFPLSEGQFTVDQTKKFIPFNPGSDVLGERPRGSLLVEIQPFAIRTNKEIILFDTGLGFESNGKLQIHENLKSAGIDPSLVSAVFLSHLHKDHAGGILDADHKPAFKNAMYFVSAREWHKAISGDNASYLPSAFKNLEASSQLNLLDESGSINDIVEYKISGGHSEYHQVFWIRQNGQTIFFGGDEAPQLQQMKHRFKAKYDFDSEKAMKLREEWWRKGHEEKWTFLFYHDIKNPTYRS